MLQYEYPCICKLIYSDVLCNTSFKDDHNRWPKHTASYLLTYLLHGAESFLSS